MADLLAFVNLLGCGIVTGTYVFEMLVVTAALRLVPEEVSAQVHSAFIGHLPNRYMPLCGSLGGFSAVALVLLGDVSDSGRVFYLAGIVSWVSTFVLLFGVSHPIDVKINAWVEAGRVPRDEYADARRRWDRFIFIRGTIGLAALSLFIIAALSDGS